MYRLRPSTTKGRQVFVSEMSIQFTKNPHPMSWKFHSSKEKFEGLVQLRDILVYIHFHKNGLTQKVLHELKYGNMPDVGEMMGKRYGV